MLSDLDTLFRETCLEKERDVSKEILVLTIKTLQFEFSYSEQNNQAGWAGSEV